MRTDGRSAVDLRPFRIEPDFIGQALGSVLVSAGKTRVICTVSLDRVPPWLTGGGWITAQYAMLPGATSPRGSRDPGGRGKEIQRLIGRSLRAAVDTGKLVGTDGPIALICDCDVIEADGGTRTAAITGAWVALYQAVKRLRQRGAITADPMLDPVAAVSVGMVASADGNLLPMLDLCYEEDVRAAVDFNVVKRQDAYVEVQGTGEHGTFARADLDAMLELADSGIGELIAIQRAAAAGS